MASRRLTGVYLAAASTLVVATMLSLHSGPRSGGRAAPAPRLEFTWSSVVSSPVPAMRPEIREELTAVPPSVHRSVPRRHRLAHVAHSPAEPAREQMPPSTLPLPAPGELHQVEENLKDNLTQELYDDFQLFLYVSKAGHGPLAQQMYVFRKRRDGDLALLYHWPVSTGRELVEYNSEGRMLPSYTPSGYYELDPHRFYRHHVSSQWHEPMPYAMFFNWIKDGGATGLAIHAASGRDVEKLGTRASAGCIRLPPEAARTLFSLIRAHYRGLVPRFAIDSAGTMSNDGIVLRGANGRTELAQGYKALVFIQDYGGKSLVAAMY